MGFSLCQAVERVRANIRQIVADTPPADTHGPAGTLVLWHHRLLHMGGQNFATPAGPRARLPIRQAVIYRYAKTEAAVPDSMLDTAAAGVSLWCDWASCVRNSPAAAGGNGSEGRNVAKL